MPTGQTVIHAGDEIIAVTTRAREEDLRRLLVE
ncbi:MAG: hypothetical protein QJR03_09750 [Sphaerobacter sp.]|nr:hypothetical protein [Sphaerobacter sp.]